MPPSGRHVGIIGAGWAGLAAAVTAVAAGHAVTLFEMAPQPGGRARRVSSPHPDSPALDNGQHLLIGAYRETLRLMALVGVDLSAALWRTPLHLVDAQGRGLRLPPGPPTLSFLRGVWSHPAWTAGERWALLRQAMAWRWRGFACASSLTVGELTRELPQRVRDELIEPLCVAALNTPADEASAQVFLRVLHDALLAGPGSADLLFPRQPLSALWPEPALGWLQAHGAVFAGHHRVQHVERDPAPGAWRVDGAAFDGVIVATPPGEAARLCAAVDPAWAGLARGLQHEPIATVYLHSPGTRLPMPMVRLDADLQQRPGQFVLDHGHWGPAEGHLALVVSGAGPWLAQGQDALTHAAQRQLTQALGPLLRSPLRPVQTLIDKRATFRCTAGLRRPPGRISDGLHAAGDYVAGPYPATLEGAVRAGIQAVRDLWPAR